MRLTRIHAGPVLDFFTPDFTTLLELPLAGTAIAAGFPSPAEEYVEIALDLNKELIKHPSATFYAKVKGDSMVDAGIQDGDLLFIDKALEPKEGSIAVCYLDGKFTVKRLTAVQEEDVYKKAGVIVSGIMQAIYTAQRFRSLRMKRLLPLIGSAGLRR